MQEVAVRYGYHPDRSDCIICPFHDDANPSLHVYTEPGRGFYCFVCSAGGSAIDFVMRLFRLNYKQALLRINSDFGFGGLPMDQDKVNQIRKEREKQKLIRRKAQEDLNRLSAEHCRLWWTIKTDDVWSDSWCDAIGKIDHIGYRLEEMECQEHK